MGYFKGEFDGGWQKRQAVLERHNALVSEALAYNRAKRQSSEEFCWIRETMAYYD